MSKLILILGGGGFIGGNLARYFMEAGETVHIADIKYHEYYYSPAICHQYIFADLRIEREVRNIFETQYDEVYQLASDVGGAGYVFSGKNDVHIMGNSAQININVATLFTELQKGVLFFSSSSCAYPAPDGSYGMEKQFSEYLYTACRKQGMANIRIGRFQNVYGTHDYIGGQHERFMTAICRKISVANNGDKIEIWGDGNQKRSFIYIDECIKQIIELTRGDNPEILNIGLEGKATINEVACRLIEISGKKLSIKNLFGDDFYKKYGYICPIGPADKELSQWNLAPISQLGLETTYKWVNRQLNGN